MSAELLPVVWGEAEADSHLPILVRPQAALEEHLIPPENRPCRDCPFVGRAHRRLKLPDRETSEWLYCKKNLSSGEN